MVGVLSEWMTALAFALLSGLIGMAMIRYRQADTFGVILVISFAVFSLYFAGQALQLY